MNFWAARFPDTTNCCPSLSSKPVPETLPTLTMDPIEVKLAEVRIKEPALKGIPLRVVEEPVANWKVPVPLVATTRESLEVDVH